MDEQLFARPRWLHGFFRLIHRMPTPDWVLGVLAAVGIAGIYHWVAWRSGDLEYGQFNRNLAAQGLYVAAAPYYWLLLARRAAQDLRRFFSESGKTQQEIDDIIADFNSLPELGSLLAVVLGAVLGLIGYRYFALPAFPVIGVVLPGLNIAVYAYSGAAYLMILARMMRQAAYMREFYEKIKVNLFKPRAIYALSSFAAFSSAAVILLVYVLVLAAFPAFILTPLGIAVQLLVFLAAGMLFFVPLSGINARMKQAKQELLDSVNEDLRLLHERIHAAARSQDHVALDKLQRPLSTLMDSREMLRSFPTWPWQPNTLRNLLAPLLLPVIVFLIQLLVTRLVER